MTPASSRETEVRRAIREKVVALAARRRTDPSRLADANNIFDSGIIDSAAAIELIVWLELTFDVSIPQSDLTSDTLGSIDAMTGYLRRARPGLFA